MGSPDPTPWCSLEQQAPLNASTPTPVWYGQADAVVLKKCSGCHASGGVAPFELESYGDVKLHADAVRLAVTKRTMPPWQAARCCNDYFEDRSLDDAEYETLTRFLSEGLPEGDAASATAMPPMGSLSRVDVTVQMPEPYLPNPPQGTDDNRCFLLDWPIDEEKYITGMFPRPQVRREVHHVIIAAVKPEAVDTVQKLEDADALPGFDCNGGFGDLRDIEVLGGSTQGGDYPRGIGHKVAKGSKLVLNIHYSTLGVTNIIPDQSSIEFRLDDTARDTAGIPIANPAWLIADAMKVNAGDPDAVYFYQYKPSLLTGNKKVLLQSVTPHMHTFGSRFSMKIIRASGEPTCLLEIPRWRFGWEQPFWLDREVELNPGDALYIECHFDNSAANQPFGEEPKDFAWGGNGQDMCAGFVSFVRAEE